MPAAPSDRAGAEPPCRAAGAAGRPVVGAPGVPVCGRRWAVVPPAAGPAVPVGPPAAGVPRDGAGCPVCAGRGVLVGAGDVLVGVPADVRGPGVLVAGGAVRAAGAAAADPPVAPMDGTAGRVVGVLGRGDVVDPGAPVVTALCGPPPGRPGVPAGRPGWAVRAADPLPAGVSPRAGALAGKASRSLRTTGASMVEDGDLTNSPRSWSFAMISLLVLPSSFASSCTRALPATALLTVRASGLCGPRVLLVDVPGAAHCCFTACSRWVDLLSVPGGSSDRTGSPPGRPDPQVRRAPRNRGGVGPCWCRGGRRPGGPGRTPDGALPCRDTPGRDAATLPGRGGGAADRG